MPIVAKAWAFFQRDLHTDLSYKLRSPSRWWTYSWVLAPTTFWPE